MVSKNVITSMENISITKELIPTEQFSFNDDSPLEYL